MSKSTIPPLPPRGRSLTPQTNPPAYSSLSQTHQQPKMATSKWLERDPRSSSMHSLLPEESARDGKRRLLLIYIHGFMGNETSFQSFPAHVHNLLTVTMAETHAVHSKIYPRYKSKKKIEFAVEDFSKWLSPHEDASTDVILLGHSMGGILEVDVTLLSPTNVATHRAFRHRIIGTINFDTPFLGMHPGLVTAGIASLFRPAPKMPGVSESTSTTLGSRTQYANTVQSLTMLSSESSLGSPALSTTSLPILSPVQSGISNDRPDPNFNSPFVNDTKMEKRSGWGNVWHFVNKHMEEGLTAATKQYFVSHLEFGGCLADISGLKSRYTRVRALEDGKDGERIRFVNYYTASTGLPKKAKKAPSTDESQDISQRRNSTSSQNDDLDPTNDASNSMHSVLIPNDSSEIQMPDFSCLRPVEESSRVSSTQIHNTNVHAQIEQLGSNSGVHEATDDELESGESDGSSVESMKLVDSMPLPISDDEFHDAEEPSIATADVALLHKSDGLEDNSITSSLMKKAHDASYSTTSLSSLPPMADPPIEPTALDLSMYTDKDAKKLAEKQYKSSMKIYQQAVKDYETAIKDRQKILDKREKKARVEMEKSQKEAQKIAEREAKEKRKQQQAEDKNEKKQAERTQKEAESQLSVEEKRLLAEARRLRAEADRMEREAARMKGEPMAEVSTPLKLSLDGSVGTERESSMDLASPQLSLSPIASNQSKLKKEDATKISKPDKSSKPEKAKKAEKVKKDRKFCLLPSDIGGVPDKCWVRVYMEGVDEVGAHCGLFFRGPQYESLVEDVGKRIREWVLES